jgi:hypothetical protein
MDLVDILSIRYNVSEESRYTIKGKSVIKSSSQNHSTAHSICSTTTYVSNPESTDTRVVKELVHILSPERANTYDTWMKVGWCLHNIAPHLLLYDWINFSKQSTKYKEGECERLWSQMRSDGLNIGSLHMWAKEDNYDKYMEFIAKHDTCNDHVLTLDDIKKCINPFSYDIVKQVFERTHAKIENPICYIETNAEGLYIKDVCKLKQTYNNLYFMEKEQLNNKTWITKQSKFIPKWLDDIRIRYYKTIDFMPPPLVCPPDTYNHWTGFKIDKIDCTPSGVIEPFCKHVRILTGNDEASYDYFIKWLAQLVQRPGELIGIALAFVSKEGAGKNIFFDSLFKMLGESYYYSTANPQRDLFGRFCNGQKYTLMVDIDETNSKDTFSNSELLKNMITSKTFNYEQKGVDPITVRNFARFIFTTNNDMCLKITDNSRRYVIFETSNEMINNIDYFTRFSKYMSDVSNQKTIMEFLRSINIEGYNFQSNIPYSETYKALRATCSDLLLQFLVDVIWKRYRIDGHYTSTASDLLNQFHKYLEETIKLKAEQMKAWNCTMFGLKMKKLIKENQAGIAKEKNYGEKRSIAYEFDIGKLEQYMTEKGLITETTYMFLDDGV